MKAWVKISVFCISLFVSFTMMAQLTIPSLSNTTASPKSSSLTIGGYLDLYYGWQSGPDSQKDMPYFVSMASNKELTVNLAYLDLKYSTEDLRVHLVPGFGTYMQANYANEDAGFKNLVEASAGVALSKKKGIWLDAGILGSPYTNESAISKDHLMYTRSLAPEYVPYYLSGVKLTMPISPKVTAYLYLLNGWQQIKDNNDHLAFGSQLEYRPDDQNLINWNTYIGDESSPSNLQFGTRYFTDVYWIHNPGGRFTLTTCVYGGNQKTKEGNGKTSNHYWWQANVIGRMKWGQHFSVSGRLEYFEDKDQVQITSLNGIGQFSTGSAALDIDYKLKDNALFRLEGRKFFSDTEQYRNTDGEASKSALWLISNFTVWF